jgi:hypothetical protein
MRVKVLNNRTIVGDNLHDLLVQAYGGTIEDYQYGDTIDSKEEPYRHCVLFRNGKQEMIQKVNLVNVRAL